MALFPRNSFVTKTKHTKFNESSIFNRRKNKRQFWENFYTGDAKWRTIFITLLNRKRHFSFIMYLQSVQEKYFAFITCISTAINGHLHELFILIEFILCGIFVHILWWNVSDQYFDRETNQTTYWSFLENIKN